MYKVSDVAKLNIEKTVGLKIDEIVNMSFDEQQQWVNNRTKSKLKFSKIHKRGVVGRGNPLLARKKIRTINDLNVKSKKYIGI